MKNIKAFTLIEMLVAITILSIIAISLLSLLNPLQQINKSWDTKRKQELAGLQRSFDDYYNDKNLYPLDTELCYDTTVVDGATYSCHICGKESPSSLPPYIAKLPCDPQHGTRDYLYQYDATRKWYKIFTSVKNDSEYNYGVNSSNTPLAPYPTIN